MGGSRLCLHLLPEALFTGQKLLAYLQGRLECGAFLSSAGEVIGGDVAVGGGLPPLFCAHFDVSVEAEGLCLIAK